MTMQSERRQVQALKVTQWLPEWNQISFSPKEHRAKPQSHFYLFSLSARELRSLSGIARRTIKGVTARAADLGIQRQHDPDRSEEIARFVRHGYPWSTLSAAKRRAREFSDLRKPGWLPTAIVVNIIGPADQRLGGKVAEKDIILVQDDPTGTTITLPYENWHPNWQPSALPPLEIIDGQHRLWAFDENLNAPSFEVPVVAFPALDISWQAYLFWTINIKPKRINSSLAFDLYPLLRTEDWLDKAEGHPVYRETRSQELTEALWSHPKSPWYDRINMLGERQIRWVTQSAWIKTLMATFVRPWEGRRKWIGGLFGSRLGEAEEVLGWSRAQQAAFLIRMWQSLYSAVHETSEPWATELRQDTQPQASRKGEQGKGDDPAFYGSTSLISTDQGVRGYMHVINDLCFVMAPNLKLNRWQIERSESASNTDAVTLALDSLAKEPVVHFVDTTAEALATFDWRSSSAPNIPDELRRAKLIFRGSSGYKELRTQLIEHIKDRGGDIGTAVGRLNRLA